MAKILTTAIATATLFGLLTAEVQLAASSPGPSVPEPSHRLKLGSFVIPPNRVTGLLVRARINGGPVLRLLLDSGAQYVTIDRKAAMRSGCAGGSELDLVGVGAAAGSAKTVAGNTVEIADLLFQDIRVLITAYKPVDGIDGALPLALFDGFLIRLDMAAHTLDLEPYPQDAGEINGAVQVRSSNRLLFLKGVFHETHEGYFLLDTGASYNAISRKLGERLSRSGALSEWISLRGATAAADAPLFPESVRVPFGPRVLEVAPVVAIDLTTASRYHAFEVSGLIGYPALRDSILVVDYRDALVSIRPR